MEFLAAEQQGHTETTQSSVEPCHSHEDLMANNNNNNEKRRLAEEAANPVDSISSKEEEDLQKGIDTTISSCVATTAADYEALGVGHHQNRSCSDGDSQRNTAVSADVSTSPEPPSPSLQCSRAEDDVSANFEKNGIATTSTTSTCETTSLDRTACQEEGERSEIHEEKRRTVVVVIGKKEPQRPPVVHRHRGEEESDVGGAKEKDKKRRSRSHRRSREPSSSKVKTKKIRLANSRRQYARAKGSSKE